MRKSKMLATLLATVALVSLCLVGCQPAASDKGGADASSEKEDAPAIVNPYDVSGYDSGILPEADYTTNFINQGNRGCGSCHGGDLYSLVSEYRQHLPYKDLATYGQDTKVTDCMTCHRPQAIGGGPMIGEAIHQAHYQNEMFTGNCFTCHATTNAGELVLFDEFIYTGELGGFPANVGSPEWQEWYALRGSVSGGNTIAGVNVVNNLVLDKVELDQRYSSLEDLFCSVNGVVNELDVETYTLTVTDGVKNPRSFTLDELKALGEVTKGSCVICAGNGFDCTQVGNIEYTGVLLEDVIEACGGLEDGVISVHRTTTDGFMNGLYSKIDVDLAEGAMLAWAQNGEPLSAEEGAPIRYVIPGWPAYSWTKYLTELEFVADAFPHKTGYNDWYEENMFPVEGSDIYNQICDPLDSAFWTPNNDSHVYKLGETVTLEGYVWAAQCGAHETSYVRFSADYGFSWTDIEVPADFDGDKWVYFTAEWTPEEPGVYMLSVKPADAGGYDTQTAASVFITIEE